MARYSDKYFITTFQKIYIKNMGRGVLSINNKFISIYKLKSELNMLINQGLVLQLNRLGNLKNKWYAMRFWEGDPID